MVFREILGDLSIYALITQPKREAVSAMSLTKVLILLGASTCHSPTLEAELSLTMATNSLESPKEYLFEDFEKLDEEDMTNLGRKNIVYT